MAAAPATPAAPLDDTEPSDLYPTASRIRSTPVMLLLATNNTQSSSATSGRSLGDQTGLWGSPLRRTGDSPRRDHDDV